MKREESKERNSSSTETQQTTSHQMLSRLVVLVPEHQEHMALKEEAFAVRYREREAKVQNTAEGRYKVNDMR